MIILVVLFRWFQPFLGAYWAFCVLIQMFYICMRICSDIYNCYDIAPLSYITQNCGGGVRVYIPRAVHCGWGSKRLVPATGLHTWTTLLWWRQCGQVKSILLSACTVLTAGEHLPLGLCKGTGSSIGKMVESTTVCVSPQCKDWVPVDFIYSYLIDTIRHQDDILSNDLQCTIPQQSNSLVQGPSRDQQRDILGSNSTFRHSYRPPNRLFSSNIYDFMMSVCFM